MPFAVYQIEDFEFFEQLGSGSFGSVYRARWKSQNKEVAVKKILSLDKEADILGVLSHRNIIQFYGAITKAPHFCLITEYAKHGSLYDYISKNEIDFYQILSWAEQIALGISYLHHEAPYTIIHRDLKSKNVVIMADMQMKLCDFGSSRYLDQTTKMTMAGTYPWMAPEVIQNLPICEACDTYSYGVILWEMLTREVPFKDMEAVQIAWLIVAKEERLLIPSCCPPIFAQLLKSCWHTNPKARPTFKDIMLELGRMLLNANLAQSTDAFIKNKKCWLTEIDKRVEMLKKLDKRLTCKEKELQDRELRLIKKEHQMCVTKMQNKVKVVDWDESDVYCWCEQLGFASLDLQPYAQVFFDNHINGERLSLLTNEDLKEMGILSHGHRIDLMNKIEKLKGELEHLHHFPPLHQIPSLESQVLNQRVVNLTLLFGNHCRLGATPMDHKWKIYIEVDGDDEALLGIKEININWLDEEWTLKQAPYVMSKWVGVPGNNSPIVVMCSIEYDNVIKKPRVTKHQHEVLLKEGGHVCQKEIELTMKESAALVRSMSMLSTAGGDDGYSSTTLPEKTTTTAGSSHHSLSSTRSLSSSRSGSHHLHSPLLPENNNGISWANKVKGQAPPSFTPRQVSNANTEVLFRNHTIANSPMLKKRPLSNHFSGRNSPAHVCTSPTLVCQKPKDDSPWTVVASSKTNNKPPDSTSRGRFRGRYPRANYQRSHSDKPRAGSDMAVENKGKLNYSEGDRPRRRGRGRGRGA